MKYLLSLRNRKTGGPVVPGRLMEGDSLGKQENLELEDDVAVLVHGFNVNRDEGRDSLLRFADMLPSTSATISVLWPGDHWTGPLSYSFEGRDADDSARALAIYLDETLPRDARISFAAHSLGCRVTMETIGHLSDRGRDVDQVCLMAAAIDDDSLAGPAQYQFETVKSDRVAVMSSKKDTVLKYSYPAGDLLQAFIFWKESGDLALGFHGPRRHRRSKSSVPTNVLDERIAKRRKVGHGDYLPDEVPNTEQQSAAKYADAVLSGDPDPKYL